LPIRNFKNSFFAQALPNHEAKTTLYNFLVFDEICKHYATIMKFVFNIFAAFFFFGAGYAVWQDLTNIYSASAPLGKLWYANHPGSLQVVEAVVSRYIDPCSLVRALDCSPFLWHPLVSTVLGWPAALVLIGLCMIFYWLSLSRGSPSGRKGRVRSLKRHGEK